MKPILPKLHIINKYNNFNNKPILKSNFSNTARLKKSNIYKLSSPLITKSKRPILLHNPSANLKLFALKNLLKNKNNADLCSNSSKSNSIREDFFSIIKKEQLSLLKKEEASPVKNDETEEKRRKNLENYQFFRKSLRNSFFKNKINIFSQNDSKNMNPKNTTLFFHKSNSTTTFISKNKRKNIFNSSISRIKSNKDLKIKGNKLSKKKESKERILSIKKYFKYEDNFIKFIIERFLDKNSQLPIDKKHRTIYIVLEGSIIINENNIQGHFINILTKKELKKLNKEKRDKLREILFEKLKNIFDCKHPIISMFSPDKEVILDLLEIKKEYKFIYISKSIMCKGLSIVTTPSFIKLYNNEFQQYLNQKKIDLDIKLKNKNKIIIHKKENDISKFKYRKINKGINPKKEFLKPHYSFASGENEITSNDYIYYSDNEERKFKAYKEIKNNCIFKNDFFIYLNEKRVNGKIQKLKKNLHFHQNFDLKQSYDNYNISFDKLIDRYKKELSKKLGINAMNFNSDADKSKNDYDFEDLDTQFDKLYLKRESKKEYLNKKLNNSFEYNVDKNVNKYYAHFVLYNIPKLLKEYKNYTRQRLFEIFTQFKDLLALSFSLNKNKFILRNGIDFNTFWNCVEELTDERENFARKLFTQINKSNSSVLNIEDFIKGMYFIQNSEITEKLELFLKSLDISGKGEINFKEAIEISKESILRNLVDQNIDNKDNLVLNELSNFFANFIFKLVGVEKDKCLKISDLKQAIIEGNNENNEVEYLEMFCGANRT